MNKLLLLTTVLLLFASSAIAQQKGKITVESFERDQFDTTAKNPQHRKDGYSIIKVTSVNADDNLLEYNFNFGYMNHEVKEHDGELWIYVQRNAKMVTISRQGYTTVNKYDLKTTIQDGETYRMLLSPKGPKVEYQMVKFTVTPIDANASIKIKESGTGLEFTLKTDVTGNAARNIPLGIYTYVVETDNYKASEGRISLGNKRVTHEEKITLIPDYAEVTLTVDSDADIYVYGEKKGTRTWTGKLRYGSYSVECKQENHRDATDWINVQENGTRSFKLSAPQPITGSLAVMSNPLNAKITIDGKDYGVTPQNIYDIVIGKHDVSVFKEGYLTAHANCEIKESQITELNLSLQPIKVESTSKVNKEKKKNEPKLKSATKEKNFHLYAGLGYDIKSNLTATLGCSYKRFSVEGFYSFPMGTQESEKIYWTWFDEPEQECYYTYSPKSVFGVNLAYTIIDSKNLAISPRIGFRYVDFKEDLYRYKYSYSGGENETYCMSGVLSLKTEYKFNKHFRVALTPEYLFGVKKGEYYKALSDVSSKIKAMAEGFNISFSFIYSL